MGITSLKNIFILLITAIPSGMGPCGLWPGHPCSLQGRFLATGACLGCFASAGVREATCALGAHQAALPLVFAAADLLPHTVREPDVNGQDDHNSPFRGRLKTGRPNRGVRWCPQGPWAPAIEALHRRGIGTGEIGFAWVAYPLGARPSRPIAQGEGGGGYCTHNLR